MNRIFVSIIMQYNILHYKESIVKSYFSFSDLARTIFYHIKTSKANVSAQTATEKINDRISHDSQAFCEVRSFCSRKILFFGRHLNAAAFFKVLFRPFP